MNGSTNKRPGWGVTLAKVGAGVTACAVVGSLLTEPEGSWYQSLTKPAFQPPNWAFPVAWTSLYAIIAITSTAVIHDLRRQGRDDEASAYAKALAVNLTLNAGWSGLFFRANNTWLSAVGAAALTAFSVDLARRGLKTGPKALGLVAYAGWCAFATVLSASIAVLNPDA
ncbi:MAG: TspO/MBR family protein [Propioniciclava sp.]|uniref:TspO/MBR family protein n=1 Tax=Propioniciclava sp. TaxID=2038686 RepID=UPI0039E52D08